MLAGVEPADLVIGDWGGTPYPLTGHAQSLSIIEAAFEARLDSATVGNRIRQEIEATRRRGGGVYFYGLLDLSETEWNVFLGQRIRLPYTVLDEYRNETKPVLTLRLKTPLGGQLHLWRLDPR